MNTKVRKVASGARVRSRGRVGDVTRAKVALRIASSPGKGALARIRPRESIASEIPELATRKIGMRYSAARNGGTREWSWC
jgi:hypothetical protein